jgi:hypothetical protein
MVTVKAIGAIPIIAIKIRNVMEYHADHRVTAIRTRIATLETAINNPASIASNSSQYHASNVSNSSFQQASTSATAVNTRPAISATAVNTFSMQGSVYFLYTVFACTEYSHFKRQNIMQDPYR